MLLPPTSLALLPFLILAALPLTNAQGPPLATGYAFCSAANLSGQCQYVAHTMAGFNACNPIAGPASGSLQVWDGTKCKISRSESCDCAGEDGGNDDCEIVEGPRLLEDLSAYRIGGKEARSFRCEVAARRR